MSNVVPFKGVKIGSGRKLTAAAILRGAHRAKLTECVVVGYEPNGDIYVAGTEGPGDTVWVLEAAKLALLRAGED